MARSRELTEHGPAWLLQAALIARRFYLDGRSKIEIADELELSRFKVARILDEARALGLVEVRVRLPAHIDAELSAAVRQRFGLRRAVVLDSPEADNAKAREDLGRVAADLLTELVAADDVLGLSCSRSVTATTQALRELASCRVVQLTGTLAGPDMEAGSVESVRRAAVVGGGKAFPIYAPMLLPDAATAQALARQPAIRQSLEQFGQVTVAMVAVGAWAADLSTVWGDATVQERTAGAASGAVGEIGARLFDGSGRAVCTPVDDRVLGVTLDQLRGVPEVIALAHGAPRAAAVHAALMGEVVDTLVCDVALGRALLDRAPARVDQRGRTA